MLHKLAEGAGTLGGLLGLALGLTNVRKTRKWNEDPKSQQLATLLTEAAITSLQGDWGQKLDKECQAIQLLAHSGWKKKEAGDRLVHAATMINWSELPREVFAETKNISKELYISLGKAW